ncbi:LOW QUALITY PROTEIN: peroxisome biogenesis factor 2 [Esox lucius]|uniref:LOW QUALITY PROTEIN: peroxisome biogenesis factor 2 n=1 Tax=Esox lucius TaxID=8010 RepID=UPI0014776300|nr:LOW QUALITY PROTEIN: peroxisome biogenesis factor 2 [Esox lucius]
MASVVGDRLPSEGGSAADPQTPVLRINQLDAFELDSALDQLVWNQLSRCFRHLRPGLLTPVEPEVKALLQLLVWRFTVYPGSATVGQSMMNLRYHDTRSLSRRYRAPSRRQTLGLALLAVGPRWLTERSHGLLLALGLGVGGGQPADGGLWPALRRALSIVTGLTQVANLINFLVFLRQGRHPTLTERILGVRAVFSRPQEVRQVAFQYMNRELLWHGFAEFLIFLLPLVSVRKIKTSVYSLLLPLGLAEEGAGGAGGGGALKECVLCGEWPTMPHSVGCGHVFCYYCIKSHSIADAYLTCPKCGAEVSELEPVKLQLEMTDLSAT